VFVIHPEFGLEWRILAVVMLFLSGRNRTESTFTAKKGIKGPETELSAF